MRKRTHPVEMFSTFLQVNETWDSLGPGWLTDPRLKKNMTRISQSDPDAPERYWTTYWLKEALKNPQNRLSRNHLSAYLEEACYWVTLKIFEQIANLNESRVDCFFIARSAAADPGKLFKNYDPIRSGLKTYAQFRLKTAILEQVRVGSSLQKYSDPALLRALTKKTLKEALKKADIKEPEFSECLLVWQCFKEVYVPVMEGGSRRLKPPDETQLAAIASLYNQKSQNRRDPVDSEFIQKRLDQCVNTVRESLRIKNVPLDSCGFEPALASDDPIDTLDEPVQEWQQVKSILSEAFATLPESSQTMLKLQYGLNFSQSEIAKIFEKHQSTISRKISGSQQILLTAIAKWSASNLGICLSSDRLQEMASLLDECLESHCQSPFLDCLKTAVFTELNAEIKLLRLYYGRGEKIPDILQELEIAQSVFDERIERVKQRLLDQLKFQVESLLESEMSSRIPTEKLSKFVEKFLVKAPYAIFK